MTPTAIMVAGPNGSGKTTLTRHLLSIGIELGRYINPDDIAAELQGSYAQRVAEAQLRADKLRADCLKNRVSFSFETVMSHPSKIEVLRRARERGFATILYFVATEHPEVNVARVAQRVAQGGHDVPSERVMARYERVMRLLPAAIAVADRAFLFDNTDALGSEASRGPLLVASVETRNGNPTVDIRPPVPRWASIALSAFRGDG